jgi:hypothetical protein
LTSYVPLPHCNELSSLDSEVEKLFELVQNLIESDLDIDLDCLFREGERGFTLESYNRLIDQLNSEIAFQTSSAKGCH